MDGGCDASLEMEELVKYRGLLAIFPHEMVLYGD